MRVSYTSDEYLGPDIRFTFRTLVVAWLRIGGELYTCAEYLDEDKYPAGTVPDDFKETARLAFIRRYLKIRAER